LSELRLGKPARTKAAAAKLEERSRVSATTKTVREANTVSHALLLDEVACVISDIVKRRSIRVLDRKRHSFGNARRASQRRYLQIVRCNHRKMVRGKTILLVTLDRIAIGPILRSNLVFLISVSCNTRCPCDDARCRTILPRMCGH